MRTLDPSEVVTGEGVIGPFRLGGPGVPPAVDVPTWDRILHGTELVVAPPRGRRVDDPATVRATAGELASLLGGPFGSGSGAGSGSGDDGGDAGGSDGGEALVAHLTLVDDLVSPEERAMYAGGGMTLGAPASGQRISWLAAAIDDAAPGGWRVQALGQPRRVHCVALLHELAEEAAIGPGGHVRPRPFPVPEVLQQLAPGVGTSGLVDRSGESDPNVADTLLEGDGARIRAGVRRVSTGPPLHGPGGIDLTPRPPAYAYVVRLDLSLRP
jgi:hypothetical protein